MANNIMFSLDNDDIKIYSGTKVIFKAKDICELDGVIEQLNIIREEIDRCGNLYKKV